MWTKLATIALPSLIKEGIEFLKDAFTISAEDKEVLSNSSTASTVTRLTKEQRLDLYKTFIELRDSYPLHTAVFMTNKRHRLDKTLAYYQRLCREFQNQGGK